eukprot:TRINITY_DN12611_c0_g1_i1.p1 TRINITY_DN12611_c0_g1~~TRINITY_DN12611_c0_g1_i1.p1  ORF type:complete len:336 (-),score=66.87 TRINITY_DN12611_c0_g1_i1:1-1008(-)
MRYGAFLLLVFFVASSQALVYYTNPIVPDSNNPDPGAIYDEETKRYYVATTNTQGGEGVFPIRSSANLVDWTLVTHIFPKRSDWPVWADDTAFWAPEIHKIDGHFVAYFVARNKGGILCVGAASSPHVTGPFKDRGEPLIYTPGMGNIDPTYHEAGKVRYLVWKEDGNGHNPPVPTPIWAQQLREDGLGVVGATHLLFQNNPSSWEGSLVEAPWVVYHNSTYYVFYSANGYASTAYAIGVARSKHLLGPYEKYHANPIIHSDSYWSGPGHCSVLRVKGTGGYFMIYHSWVGQHIGGNYPRVLMMDKVTFDHDGWPRITKDVPSHGPQKIPPRTLR